MRLIDADCLISTTKSATALCAAITGNEAKKEFMKETCNFICELVGSEPTIPAVLVRHGKWNYKNYEDFGYVPCCSVCGEPDALSRDDYAYRGGKIRDNHSDYCPNCGAKMDGGTENA